MPDRVKEKLVELLREGIVFHYFSTCEEQADHLLANGVTVQEWIPSKERKPTKEDADKYGRVLVMEIGMIAIVNYLGPINYPDRFPHWMPLPQTPKGE